MEQTRWERKQEKQKRESLIMAKFNPMMSDVFVAIQTAREAGKTEAAYSVKKLSIDNDGLTAEQLEDIQLHTLALDLLIDNLKKLGHSHSYLGTAERSNDPKVSDYWIDTIRIFIDQPQKRGGLKGVLRSLFTRPE